MAVWQRLTLPPRSSINISRKAEEAHEQKSASEARYLIKDLPDSERNYHKPLTQSAMTSDIGFLELGTGEGRRPPQARPPFRRQLPGQRSVPRPPSLLTTVYKFGDSHQPLRLDHSREQFAELTKPRYVRLKSHRGKRTRIGTTESDTRGEAWEGGTSDTFCPLPAESGRRALLPHRR